MSARTSSFASTAAHTFATDDPVTPVRAATVALSAPTPEQMTAAIRRLTGYFQRLTEVFGDVETRIDKDAKLYAGIARLASTASDRQKTSLDEIQSLLGVITTPEAQTKCVEKFQSLQLKDMVREKYGTQILDAAAKYMPGSEHATEP